jgi:hypothetical protein
MKGDRLATDSRYVKLADKTTAQQAQSTIAIGGAAAEGVRNLDQMARFGAGTTQSPFIHLTDHDATGAIATSGANALTPEQVQMFQTSGAGLAQEISRVMTLGGGRGPNQTQINEIHRQIIPAAGDTQATSAYKLSTGAQILLTRMEATPPPADATAKAKWDQTMDRLRKYPTPETILHAATGKSKKQLETMQGSYNDLLDKINDGEEEGLPGTPDTGAGTKVPPVPAGGGGGLPAGWSVKVH